MFPKSFIAELHKPDSKGFLWALYSIDPASASGTAERSRRKKVLKAATSENLNLLIDCLHFIAQGCVVIKKIHFEKLKKGRKLPHFQKYFDEEREVNKLKGGTKSEKIRVLCHIAFYRELLFPFFN